MTSGDFTYGFRVLDSAYEERRLVDHAAAFAAYAECDELAECHRVAYLSHFLFDEGLGKHMTETGSTAGYSGPCWVPWLWWDVDSPNLGTAQRDAARLALWLDERYCPGDDDLPIFFSGSKGFHIGLPTCLWTPTPSADFNQVARRFAESAAGAAAVATDDGIYDRVRLFRAPNSRHPKTGLHKRRLSLDELANLKLDAILSLAKEPSPFDLPTPTGTSDQAAADWQAAIDRVAAESEAAAARRAAGAGATLNRATLGFIRDGAVAPDRHRTLFSAAANLAEFGCPPALAVALLEESALDSGLPPKEVRRQIECGLAAAASALPAESTHQDAPGTPETVPGDSMPKKPLEAVTSDSGGSEGQACQQATGATESAAPPAVLPAAVQDRPPDVQAADTPSTPPAVDLQGTLARMWVESSAPPPTPTAVSPPALESPPPPPAAPPPPLPAVGLPAAPATLPPLPPPLPPLPAGAVDSGTLDEPCRCGSSQYVDIAISGGRTRRDCRKCGRFLGWGKWYGHNEGGPPQ